MGAVFSDALVWSICGEGGREKYRLRRQAEIASLPHFKERGIDACFHNTEGRLKAVDEFHRFALDNRRIRDNVSEYMSNLILDFMLVDQTERLTAMQIKTRADKWLKGIQYGSADRGDCPPPSHGLTREQTNDISVLPESSSHHGDDLHHVTRRRTVPAGRSDFFAKEPFYTYPDPAFDEPPTLDLPQTKPPSKEAERPMPSAGIVTVESVYAMMEMPSRKHSVLSQLSPRPDKSTVIMSLPGMEDARRKIKAYNGRDQVSSDCYSISIFPNL